MKISLRTKEGWHEQANKGKTTCDVDGLQLYRAPHNGLYCDREHAKNELTFNHFTLAQIRAHNTIFFSEASVRVHADVSYTLEVKDEQQMLRLKTTRGVVYYSVENNGSLKYSNG